MALPIPTWDSPVIAPPRITKAKFKERLQSKNSPAVPESDAVYDILIAQGVDPCFALAQFRVESQYGTAGFAKVTGSWGNMLDDPLCTHESGTMTFTTDDGTKFTYATYDNYVNAITDYCAYIHHFADAYNLHSIYDVCGRWLGPRNAGSAGHIKYVNIVIDDMIDYMYPTGGYESGDEMVYAGAALDRSTGELIQKYPVTFGMTLYRGTDGTILKTYAGTPGNAWWLGFVNGGTAWGAIFIGTSSADADATLVYIKNPDPKKIINV